MNTHGVTVPDDAAMQAILHRMVARLPRIAIEFDGEARFPTAFEYAYRFAEYEYEIKSRARRPSPVCSIDCCWALPRPILVSLSKYCSRESPATYLPVPHIPVQLLCRNWQEVGRQENQSSGTSALRSIVARSHFGRYPKGSLRRSDWRIVFHAGTTQEPCVALERRQHFFVKTMSWVAAA